MEEGKTSEKLSEALETTVQVVLRAEEYAKLFSTHSSSSTERVFQSLQENLTHLYAEVLNFLIRATNFFKKSTLSIRPRIPAVSFIQHPDVSKGDTSLPGFHPMTPSSGAYWIG